MKKEITEKYKSGVCDTVQWIYTPMLLNYVGRQWLTLKNDLKSSKQCSEVGKIANKLGHTFEHKSEKVILTLYNFLVRPLLAYCIQFWCPYYRMDIDKLERVQRRVTKMIPRLRCKPYEERLQELNLFSLSKRRMRGDLIEVFKMFKGFVNVDVNDYFTLAQSRVTRGNGYATASKGFSSQEAKHFFFKCIVKCCRKRTSCNI